MTCAPSSAHTRPADGRIAAAGDMLLVDGVAIALGASPVSVTLGRLVFPSNESSARSPRSPRTLLPRCDFFPQLLSAVRVPAGLALSHAEIESGMRKTTVRQVRPRGCAQRAPRRAKLVRGRQILCDFPPTWNLKNRNWQKQRAGWWLRRGGGAVGARTSRYGTNAFRGLSRAARGRRMTSLCCTLASAGEAGPTHPPHRDENAAHGR